MGEEGKRLQDEMLARAKQHGIRLIGPNCPGLLRPSLQLNPSLPAPSPPPSTSRPLLPPVSSCF